MNAEDFEKLVRSIGLDPAEHDLEELRAARARLFELFSRLRTAAPAAEAESLAVFDPRKPL